MIKPLRKKFIFRVLIGVVILANLAMFSVFVFHEYFNFTSSNSALYLLKGKKGGIEISRDLLFEDADRLIFMLDANCVFNYFMRGIAVAKGKPVLELTWDAKEGIGDIKQFRTDGTILSLSFSRYKEDSGTARGLFLGGDLPYGDTNRSEDESSSGFGYYDGDKWSHIWCAANEGLSVNGLNKTAIPPLWDYDGSRVIKDNGEEAIIESEHSVSLGDNRLKMKRYVRFRAGDDYFLLKVKVINASVNIISYGYAYGDEPWVGNFGASAGDVGWYGGGLVEYETLIPAAKYHYAGYWDHGNEQAGERHEYTDYANFIEWVSPTPTYVYFSNDLNRCCSGTTPLSDQSNRVLNVEWLNQVLMPGESRDHVMAVGMARFNPETRSLTKQEISLE